MPTFKNNDGDNKIPLIALVGLPNSGKSTLLNRLGHSRYKAVVANEAHTTRDLNYAEDYWDGMYMHFVDTGGLVPSPEDKIQKLVQLKSWEAIAKADLLVWVFDKTTKVDNIAQKITQGVWKSKKPFIIGINKIDNPNHEKNEIDYVQFGGRDFVNFSAANGYNLNVLMDKIIEQLQGLGFKKGNFNEELYLEEEESNQKTKKQQHQKIVRKKADGSYYVVRETNDLGEQTNFRALSAKEIDDFEKNTIAQTKVKNLIWVFDSSFDLLRLDPIFDQYTQVKDLDSTEVIEEGEEEARLEDENQSEGAGQPVEYNNIKINRSEIDLIDWSEYFINQKLELTETVVISSNSDILDAVRKVGAWGVYFDLLTNLKSELRSINSGKMSQKKQIPKILFIGKPNVGKSSLFNALAGTDIQIVSEVAGTTLSVNDTLIIRDKSLKD